MTPQLTLSKDRLTKTNRDRKWDIPFNSVYATSAIVALLSLINLGSSLAFEILVSLSLQGLLTTYLISIGKSSEFHFDCEHHANDSHQAVSC